MPGGPTPSVSLSGRNATVSWTAVQFGDGTNVNGYSVHRYASGNGVAQTVGSSCSGTISALICTENSVPVGSWFYTVAAAQFGWSGGEGAPSSTVTINAPSLVFSPAPGNITLLPKTLTGSIFNFLPGETVTWRLDNPVSGTILTGAIVPSPVPSSGTSTFSVVIPLGTSDGSHVVYALGSGGSTASGTIAVNVSDTTPPVVTAAAIAKTTGGTAAYIHQGGTYYVYANANDPGSPSSGVASVTANVGTITTGQTGVNLVAGSYTVGGVTYGYRSGALTANNPLAAGSKSFTVVANDAVNNTSAAFTGTVTVDDTAPSASDVQTTNVAGGTAGHAEPGDAIVYTYSESMEPVSFVAGWAGAARTVTVRLLDKNGAGGDRIQIYDQANTSLLPLGTIKLGRTDYTAANVSFTASTMVLSGSTITVRLGTPSGTVGTAAGTGTLNWAPSSTATDWAGNACSTTAVNESGPADVDF
jgi:hypothetical protein